jgi:hypothetical protein
MPHTNDKVTIYCKDAAGNIVQHEVHFLRVVDHGTNGADVVFRKKRGRSEYVVSSFYSSFWEVVDGWGHPRPDSLYARGGDHIRSDRLVWPIPLMRSFMD